MNLTKIVITGGPCAGKTTAIDTIIKTFTEKGYHVIIIPETATELMEQGISPSSCQSRVEFQKILMGRQIEKEAQCAIMAMEQEKESVLIVSDRGLLDSKVYVDREEFEQLLDYFQLKEEEILQRYDVVIHLVTAAKGAEEFYTTANNQVRTETVEEAAALDDKLIDAWDGHPNHRIVGNEGSFQKKLDYLIEVMNQSL